MKKALKELIEAGDNLSLMAQTSGGVTGRDDELVRAIERWQEAKNKFIQIERIERLEPYPGVAVGAGK